MRQGLQALIEVEVTATAGDVPLRIPRSPRAVSFPRRWSHAATHQDAEVLLVIHSPQLAAHFTREIDRLWKGAELGITDRLARKLQRGRERCGSGVERVQSR